MQKLTDQAVKELKLVAPDSAKIVNDEHAALLTDCEESKAKATSAKDRALRIGAELKKVKQAIPGRFIAWVEANCSFCRRTATKYILFADGNHGSHVTEDMTLRQAYVALGIIPSRPHEGGSTFRGSHIPSVYDPLNALTRFLGAVDNSGTPQQWETDENERRVVQQQYKPQLETLILRLFGVKVELPGVVE